jgi:hypothetical protein
MLHGLKHNLEGISMTKTLARAAVLAALLTLAGTAAFAQLQAGRILGTA